MIKILKFIKVDQIKFRKYVRKKFAVHTNLKKINVPSFKCDKNII